MNSLLRLVFLIYFITHIPVTICVDLQILFGSVYPEALQSVFSWYIANYNDLIVARSPLWVRSFIWAELLFQLPFFFVATYGLLKRKNWIRIPSILYGAHVATTVWAILAEILFGSENSPQEKLTLFGFYAPYFAIPALLAGYMALHPEPFPRAKQQ